MARRPRHGKGKVRGMPSSVEWLGQAD